jgi:disulfide bond formation protein DsbB
MQAQRKQDLFSLFTLLILPAPLTFVALFLVIIYLVMFPQTLSFDFNGDDAPASAPARAAAPLLSAEAAALATISAAPVRTAVPAEVGEAGASEVAMRLGYDQAMLEAGQRSYLSVCAACHGTDARGITGNGKTLINSNYVRSLNDQDLLAFINTGRQPWDEGNTTGVTMPGKGGNPGLTDKDILSIIAFIRVLDNHPGANDGSMAVAPSAETPAEEEPVASDPNAPSPSAGFVPPSASDLIAGLGGGNSNDESPAAPESPATISQGADPYAYVPADLSSLNADDTTAEPSAETPGEDEARTGEAIYNEACGTRYGQDLGIVSANDMCAYLLSLAADPDFSDADFIALLAAGEAQWNNEAGVNIPAGVLYPPLTEAELKNFIAYLRELAAQ